MKRKSFWIAAAMIILAIATMLINQNFSDVINAGINSSTTIGDTEDSKGNGFSDTRKMVRDTNGNLYFLSREKNEGDYYQLFVYKSTDNGGTWSLTNGGNPISNADYHARVGSIAIDSANRLHVVWYQSDSDFSGANERVIKYCSSSDAGASWSNWKNIGAPTGYTSSYSYWQEHPVIQVGSDDTLYVAWEGRTSASENGRIMFTKSTDHGLTWSPYKIVYAADSNNTQSRPAMVIDSNQKIWIAMYRSIASGICAIYATSSTDGGSTFAPWTKISTNDAYDNRHVSLAVKSNNEVWAVWRGMDATYPNTSQIRYRKFTTAWQTEYRLTSDSANYCLFPSVGIDNNDDVHFVYWKSPGGANYPNEEPVDGDIYYKKQLNGTWQGESRISSGSNNATWPNLRWSNNFMNGGYMDITYQEGSSSPYLLKHYSNSAVGGDSTPTPTTSPNQTKMPLTIQGASADDGNVPANVLDGNLTTRFASNNDGAYIILKANSSFALETVKIAWHNGNTRQFYFEIFASSDNVTYTKVFPNSGNATSSGTTTTLESYDVTDMTAQYIKVVGHENSYNTWFSPTEIEVWGTATAGPTPTATVIPTSTPTPIVSATPTPTSTTTPIVTSGNLALNKSVTCSTEQSGNEASHINDNITSNRWSGSPYPAWVRIDLGALYIANKTEIVPYSNRAYQYKIEVSADGANYTTVIDKTNNTTGGALLSDTFANIAARYIRLTVTGCYNYTGGWASICEFRVFNTAAPQPTTSPQPSISPIPTTTPIPIPTPVVTYGVRLYEEVRIGTGGGKSLYASIAVPTTNPSAPMPALIYIYGGGWMRGSRTDHLSKIAGYVKNHGYIGVAIEYRHTPGSTYPAQVQDVKLAVRYLRAHAGNFFIDPNRIGVWGVSAGAHLASMLGTTADLNSSNTVRLNYVNPKTGATVDKTVNVPNFEGAREWLNYSDRVQAVCDWYGPNDFLNDFADGNSSVKYFLGDNPYDVPDLAELAVPGTYASPDDAAFFIRHGTADTTVPYEASVVFKNELIAGGVPVVDFELVAGQEHGFEGDARTREENEAWAFLETYLKNR